MPTYDLGLEHVSLAFATKNIFTDVTQGVFEGDRIGIVGKNGDGKSTLLHLFKGTQEPDSGRVTMRNGLTFGMLDQRDPLDDNATVREAALEGREDYEWAAETKSREIVEALLGGITWTRKSARCPRSAPPRRPCPPAAQGLGSFSRLDEPTNHLDVVTIHWLAEHLKNRWPSGQGALLARITHDRWFLDEVCESMWEVHDGVIDPFEGGYSAYMLQRVERDRQADVRETKRRNPGSQGARMADPWRPRPLHQAEVPCQGRARAHRRRATGAQHVGAEADGHVASSANRWSISST